MHTKYQKYDEKYSENAKITKHSPPQVPQKGEMGYK